METMRDLRDTLEAILATPLILVYLWAVDRYWVEAADMMKERAS